MSEPLTRTGMFDTDDRNVIEGHRVEDRRTDAAVVLYDTRAGKALPKRITTIHELLLDDGRVIYQCASRPDTCHKYANTAASVNAHMKTHGAKAELARAKAKLDAIEAKRAQNRTNRINGARKAAEIRQTRRTSGSTSTSKMTGSEDTRSEIRRTLVELNAAMISFEVYVDEMMTEMKIRVKTLLERVDALELASEVDDETRAMLALIKTIQKKN